MFSWAFWDGYFCDKFVYTELRSLPEVIFWKKLYIFLLSFDLCPKDDVLGFKSFSL